MYDNREYFECEECGWSGYPAPDIEDDSDGVIEIFVCPVCDNLLGESTYNENPD